VRPIALLFALTLVACGAPAQKARPVALRPGVEGLITEIRTEGRAVVAFTLDSKVEQTEVLIDPARDYGFDLNHLKEHRDLMQPVRVTVEERKGGLYAVSIDDA
jgi:hypothetical protein